MLGRIGYSYDFGNKPLLQWFSTGPIMQAGKDLYP
uniref:Uncharacterized protein n=1 Tax=Rhizophora mucronata TaxID=61149 RepID=A0A2P2PJN2_RHIMU